MKDAEGPLLEVRNLSIRFDFDGKQVHAVKDVSLNVGRGEIVGLIGQSGSGKTTLAMGILGLLRGAPGVWKGEARLDGVPLIPFQKRLLKDLRGRKIAVIFQEPRAALDPYFKVSEHMFEALKRNPASGFGEDLRTQAFSILRDVGLEAEDIWALYPHQISGGMAQRVMIAMALCASPELLIADEPSTALDVTTQAMLLELFRRLQEKYGLSILLISHDIGVIREVCRRVYVMHEGNLVEQGETAVVLRSPRHAYTLSLIQAFQGLQNPQDGSVEDRTSAPLVEIRDLRKQFLRNGKPFMALNGVSLSIADGETYALVGESGSGKSTLALSLMALQSVDGGEIFYRRENLFRMGKTHMRAFRREVRMLFQHPEAVLNEGMTVAAILAESLQSQGVGREEIRTRMAEALEQVHLDAEFSRRYPANLSAGEKQRVALARALMTRPKLLVCDEPVASLDLTIQAQVIGLLQGLQARRLACLFISHNLALVKLLAHRIGVLYMGRLVEEAPAAEFTLERVRHPYSSLLLASAPSIDAEGSATEIRAEVPDAEPAYLEEGCPFRNRCQLYLKNRALECETVVPSLKPTLGGGLVACHLARA